ncbi:LacI family DNA-binding transcriptional regulator [Alteromonas sediminis]|uniref:LacI family DNA-binding transcriptional regulator n=1 Tax=Alteromonas sediminis TaxID=2259342 RepID=A0A3N5Y9V6_9ALTE|nr:LacI family DNA-binding transcriptional regulator [Alteromonas sediminis]RPJ68149.1 LacI family DNA-binding transcriptional regulator [Alteromonas sediminis]
MATIYEVSKLAGVSLATVSRVINDSNAVRKTTKDKVERAMKQLNYTPNSAAKSLASNRSDCIGVLVSELKSSFFTRMMGAIDTECRQFEKHIVVTSSENDALHEKEGIEFLISRNCDALILHVESLSDEYLIELSRGKVPVVILNRQIPQISDHCISLNNELGGYLATKTMLQYGHRDIVYIAGPEHKKDAMQRLAGHRRALMEANIPVEEARIFSGDYLQSGGQNGFKHFHKSGLNFSAVVCGNDEMATGVMATAREYGLSLPEDLSIIGFDNVLFSQYTYPRLTTIENPITDMGKMAARMIMENVYKKSLGTIRKSFEPVLVPRESVCHFDAQV